MNHNCSTARYLGYFEHGMTRKAFRLATQPTGFLWVNATIWRLRQQGWIASSPRGWVLTKAGREVWMKYLGVKLQSLEDHDKIAIPTQLEGYVTRAMEPRIIR